MSSMEELKRLSETFYESCIALENEARNEFNRIDEDGDGKIRLHEFLAYMKNAEGCQNLADRQLFRELAAGNGDGTLNFSEFKTVYYLQKSGRSSCEGCGRILVGGPFFCCFKCYRDDGQKFAVCEECFRGKQFVHNIHGASDDGRAYFYDNYMLLEATLKESRAAKAGALQALAVDASGNQRTKAVNANCEELFQVSKAFFRAANEEIKQTGFRFYNALDKNGDGMVDLPEFVEYLRKEGYGSLANSTTLKMLDRDGNGTLDFMEVMTLLYVIGSRRPQCDGCGDLIPATYFSCFECYKIYLTDETRKTFNLCLDCFRSGQFSHRHKGRPTQFFDTYSLLEATVKYFQFQQQGTAQDESTGERSYSANQNRNVTETTQETTGTPRYTATDRIRTAIQVANTVISAASLIATVAGCVIL